MKTLKQLCFSFLDVIKGRSVTPTRIIAPPSRITGGKRDHALEKQACHWLNELGLTDGAKSLRVEWNQVATERYLDRVLAVGASSDACLVRCAVLLGVYSHQLASTVAISSSNSNDSKQ